MHSGSRILVAAAAAACVIAASAVTAGSAGASASEVTVTAVTQITNNGTVPGYGGNWASSQVVRSATVKGGAAVPLANCGVSSGACYAFTASVHDSGSFQAIAGALTPSQAVPGTVIKTAVEGSVRGYTEFATFYATALPDAGLVPGTFTDGFFTTDWPEMFFSFGTTFTGLNASPWSFLYSAHTTCGYQSWTDSSTNDFGDLAGDGNITGC